MNPTLFEQALLEKQFASIYRATSLEFQQILTQSQFEQTMQQFCEPVKTFKLSFHNSFLNLQHYTWLNKQKDRAIFASFDSNYTIQSVIATPYKSYAASDQRWTKNTYEMPFLNNWYVFWGGTNRFQNYHYDNPNERYAYDFVKVLHKETYRDLPTRNENYYAFGEFIVAPCNGKVIAIVDGIPDNIPGEINERQPAGNYVIISHAHNEFSVLAHLQQNSIIVNVGEAVIAGQTIGRCGNSGNSSEPHLHFHVMNSDHLEEGISIRVKFSKTAPVQGDIVSSTEYVFAPKEKLDTFDKVEASSTFIDFLMFIPRMIAILFK